ncbi:MAG TPA: hypothetical protein VKE69_02190 [Planctomycetota bacterium]|nr:hypothetical protein [Planctomycetota bacterium]
MNAAPLVVACFFLLSGPADRIVRTYPAAPLRARLAPAAKPTVGPFVHPTEGDGTPADPFFGVDETPRPPLAADELQDLIRAALPSGGPDDAIVDVVGESVVVSASEAQHRVVAAVLRDLDAAVARPIPLQVAVRLLDAPTAASLPALTPAADAARLDADLARAGRLVWSTTVDAAAGRLAVASSLQRIPFVGDYGVDVAKKAKTSRPIEWIADAGVQIALKAAPVADGSAIHVSALVSRSTLLELGRYVTRPLDLGTIEIPRVAEARVASTATIPLGATLVLRAGSGEGGETIVTLRPTGAAGPQRLGASAGARPVAIVPMQVVTAGEGRLAPAEWGGGQGEVTPGTPLLSSIGASGDVVIRPTASGHLVVSGDETRVAAAVASARALEDGETPTYELAVRLVRAASPTAALAPTAPTVASCQLTASARRSAGAIFGIEETGVTGYAAAIAEEVSIADPRVEAFFRGTAARARVIEAAGANARVEIEVRRHDFGPRETRVAQGPDVGDQERIPRRLTTVLRTVEIGGGPVVLGDVGGPAGGERVQTVDLGAGPVAIGDAEGPGGERVYAVLTGRRI